MNRFRYYALPDIFALLGALLLLAALVAGLGLPLWVGLTSGGLITLGANSAIRTDINALAKAEKRWEECDCDE